jgi:hypothetical protein
MWRWVLVPCHRTDLCLATHSNYLMKRHSQKLLTQPALFDRHFNLRNLAYVDKCVSPEKGIFSGGNSGDRMFCILHTHIMMFWCFIYCNDCVKCQ